MRFIRQIRFRHLTSTTTYMALGGVRFYDTLGNVIPSGTRVNDSTTQNFAVSISGASNYSTSALYRRMNIVDTTRTQNGDNNSYSYWLSSSGTARGPATITITFRSQLAVGIGKIEFVPMPGSSTDRHIRGNFIIDALDQDGYVISSYSVNAITSNRRVQTVFTPELSDVNFDLSDAIKLSSHYAYDDEEVFAHIELENPENNNGNLEYRLLLNNQEITEGSKLVAPGEVLFQEYTLKDSLNIGSNTLIFHTQMPNVLGSCAEEIEIFKHNVGVGSKRRTPKEQPDFILSERKVSVQNNKAVAIKSNRHSIDDDIAKTYVDMTNVTELEGVMYNV